ncbi:MAG: 3'-phosphoesterase [Candidatus Aminicenantes bacterium]|nr:3'-phosphoesterase [Candidatus Aminicenantes bacterium]
MSLKDYRKKRDFGVTPEPAEARLRGRKAAVYAVQKHEASHLHYDLRLEAGGVLKSWAVPKEPPTAEGVKRLAVETEDHPLGYEEFTGTIPAGEYGAGRVAVWDKGSYTLLERTARKWVVEIRGRRLRGRFALLKLKPKPGEDDKNWLFFKLKEGR